MRSLAALLVAVGLVLGSTGSAATQEAPKLPDAKTAAQTHLGVGILAVGLTPPLFAAGYYSAGQQFDATASRDFAHVGYSSFRFGMAFGLASILHGGRLLKYTTPRKAARFPGLVDNPTWRHLHWVSAALMLNAAFSMPSMLRHLVWPGENVRAVFLEGFMTIAVATGCLAAGIVAGGAARTIETSFKGGRSDDPDQEEYDEYDEYDYFDLEDEDSFGARVAPPLPLFGVVPTTGGATAVIVGLW